MCISHLQQVTVHLHLAPKKTLDAFYKKVFLRPTGSIYNLDNNLWKARAVHTANVTHQSYFASSYERIWLFRENPCRQCGSSTFPPSHSTPKPKIRCDIKVQLEEETCYVRFATWLMLALGPIGFALLVLSI